jgi:hypothetical protein
MLFDLSLLGICNSKDSGMIGINSSAVSHLIFHLIFPPTRRYQEIR